MAMIYGLNYFGSSLVGPNWACAPGMQTLAACRAICVHREGRRKGWGAAWQAPAPWRRCLSHPWVVSAIRLLELGIGYKLSAP